ncbi:polyphosphate polymerase domain-containing protein [Roseobacter sp. EG26]|uniref:polyphosphate polymerase domain-containing protein n=1 Tax=Roseobacter sp. EG26 TaxID=3412477 RepID=UPI00261496BA|nr:polyphosphate polymerase domain-containing protein [uncultured Roseobacter sp.]
MSFRKERKFRLTSSDAKKFRALLLGRGMSLLHPNRKIASQYFDTRDLQAFRDSEEGVLPRFKIRVRWYNDDQSSLSLERKTSSVEGRFKTTKAVKAEEFANFIRNGIVDQSYGNLIPSVCIEYRRSYFNYEDLRITFDSDIRYRYSGSARQFRDLEEVVEIKAPFEVPDNYLETIVPVPSSRFSKYARSFLHRENAI